MLPGHLCSMKNMQIARFTPILLLVGHDEASSVSHGEKGFYSNMEAEWLGKLAKF